MKLTPKEIVAELDKFIIGQASAKRAVAIALRNRYRRQQVAEPLRSEITPKNILMIGPTGVGKTEIARRLAKLADAPFIKVEATKFTEVGYVGRDVDSIIRDLIEVAVKNCRDQAKELYREQGAIHAENRILDIFIPPARNAFGDALSSEGENATRNKFRKKLRKGDLDQQEIEIELLAPRAKFDSFSPPGMEELGTQLQGIFEMQQEPKKKKRTLKVKEALRLITEEECGKLVNEDDIRAEARENVEQNGIVFLDEIDKVASKADGKNADVSRSGVQRDLLPLVEGTAINTKYGIIKTDHILFIASGAFHLTKPSDLLPELQGRFPIRVEMNSLTIKDFEQILTATEACLTEQYIALLKTEGVKLKFHVDGVAEMAKIAFNVNEKTENIGARRLYTVIEKLLEDYLFDCSEHKDISINLDLVRQKLGGIAASEDLSRYIL